MTTPAFDQIIYWIVANRDDFDVPTFRSSLPEQVRELDDLAVLIPSEHHPQDQYHVLFGWTIDNEEISLTVEFNVGSVPDLSLEAGTSTVEGPAAEELMSWLGKFFGTTSVTAHAHARYRFPVKSRAPVFELSLKTAAPYEARLYGVALQLPDKPEGIVSVRLTHAVSDWYAELIADREIVFSKFSVFDESTSLEMFLNSFLPEVAS